MGLVTGPHAGTPAPTASGYLAPAARPNGGEVGVGRAPDPGRPTPRQEAPPPGTLMPPLQRAKPVRKSARCGVDDGSPCPHPPHPQPVGSGPRAARPNGGVVGGGRAPVPGHPTPRQEAPPPGTLMPPPQRAKSAPKSARCGVGDGSPCPHHPHPKPVGSGPRPHARKDERSGVGETARPRTPHTQAGCAPPGHPHAAPTARKAMGLLTGPHARSPRTQSHRVVSPGGTPKRTSGWSGRAPNPGRPTPRQEAPCPGTFMPPPQRAKPARKSARCGVDDGSPRPHPPHPQPVGSGPRPHVRKDEWPGLGERPTPGAPHAGKRRPPRAPSCRPYSAPSQRARPACRSARGGVGDGSPQ